MTSNTTITESDRSLARRAACCLAVLLLGGCQQETHCQELGDCGGDLLGAWSLRAPDHGSCSEDLYIPPGDKRLVDGDLVAARLPPPEPAFTDWCGGLIAGREDIFYDGPLFYNESSPIGVATLRFNGDGSYDGGFGITATHHFTFSASCMRQFGPFDGRPPPGVDGMYDPNSTEPPVDVCKQLEVPLNASGIGEGAYRNVTCVVNPQEAGGCVCYFDRAEVFGFAGRWAPLSSNEVLLTPTSAPNFAHRLTYCRAGESLEVTGSDGAYLLGYPGLRNMNMARSSCTDGIRNQDETDVDCGGLVCAACAAP